MYVGTDGDKGKGIHAFRLQSAGTEVFQNVTLVPLGLAAEAAERHLLRARLARRRGCLPSARSNDSRASRPARSSAYAIDAAGKLALLNRRAVAGHAPVSSGARQRRGGTCSWPTAAPATSWCSRSAPTAISARRRTPKPVSAARAVRHVRSRRAASRSSCDPASDRIATYGFDAARGQLTAQGDGVPRAQAGAGPRQMVFRPDGRFAYVLNSKTRRSRRSSYDDATGALAENRRRSARCPNTSTAPIAAGELHMHRTGKWLYASNVGHNSVVLFTTDFENGHADVRRGAGHRRQDAAALRHRAVGQTPGDLEHGLRHGAGVAHRRGQRPIEAVGDFRRRALARRHPVPAAGRRR